MKAICLYFQVHQPFRLRTYRFFDIGHDSHYYDDYQNKDIVRRIAANCYLPMNKVLLDLISRHGSAFKVSFSISGHAIEQFERYTPEVIDSFRQLAESGSVEFLSETYSHSLASLKSKDEFFRQVNKHAARIESLFGHKPTAFRNTELIYSDGIGEMVAELGYQVMLTEGAKHVLGWKSPNFMYTNAINPKLKLLLRNFRLSDDMSFRFSERDWNEWPLTAVKFASWLNAVDPQQEVVNLFMDYETFGEHQRAETGIFEFMKSLPDEVFANTPFRFHTPTELAGILQPVSAIHVPYPISWADEERDLTAWLGNELQDQAFDSLFRMERSMQECQDPALLRDWEYLQASDHFYYMCTKWFSDGEVHKYFNPYPGAYEAFINYMNVVSDFQRRVKASLSAPAPEGQAAENPEVKAASAVPGRKVAYGWSDLASLKDAQIKEVAKAAGNKTLALAMIGSSKAIIAKVLGVLDKRNASLLLKYMDQEAKADLNVRKEAKTKIVNAMSRLTA